MNIIGRIKKAYILTAVSAVLAVSCTKQSLETLYSEQETAIDSYIETLIQNNPATEIEIVYNNGANRAVLVQGDGTAAGSTSTVRVIYALYVFSRGVSTSNLVATNDEEVAAEAGWTLTDQDFTPAAISLSDKNLISGLKNGLQGVKAGEECMILFSGKHGYGKKKHGSIPANSALAYSIRVIAVE